MAKRPPPGRCVHCLEYFDLLTWDHVFPASWYPDTTPRDLEKWKIPSCKKCNKDYGKLEEDLLLRLGLCISPKEAKFSGITDKVLRSINPKYAGNEKDRLIRQRKREKIKNEITESIEPPLEGILPNFGPQDNTKRPIYSCILISDDKLKSLGHKLARGITYVLGQSFIEEDYRIDIFFVHESNTKNIKKDVIDPMNKFGKTYHRGPGLSITRAVAGDDDKIATYIIEIWGKLKMYVTVLKRTPNELLKLNE